MFWLFLVVGLPFAGYMAIQSISLITSASLSWFEVLSFVIGTVLLVWFISTSFEKVVVDVSGVSIIHPLWKRKTVLSWQSVCGIGIGPLFFSGSNFIKFIPCDGTTNFQINTLFHKNGEFICKAIIEAASIANPKMSFDIPFKEFGPPPYGIFTDRKVNP